MGRKRLPQWQKDLRGTGRSDRPPMNEQNYSLVTEMPEPPEGLGKVGAETWYRVCANLMEARRLTEIGLPQVFDYAANTEIWKDAITQVMKEGAVLVFPNGAAGVSPWYKAAQDARRQMGTFERNWGLTPKAMQDLPPPAPDERDALADEFNL